MGVRNVRGLSDLLATFRRLPEELKGNPTRSALRKAMEPVRDDAIRRAPLDEGDLRRNIYTRKTPLKDLPPGSFDGQDVLVRQQGKRGDPRNAYYWRFVEFGTAQKPAAPFLRPAFEANKSAMISDYTREFRRNVDRAVEKAKGR